MGDVTGASRDECQGVSVRVRSVFQYAGLKLVEREDYSVEGIVYLFVLCPCNIFP